MSKFDAWGNENDSDSSDGWGDSLEFDRNNPYPRKGPACGGVRYDAEDSTGSLDWGFVISTFFGVGAIAIIGHLVNMWLN